VPSTTVEILGRDKTKKAFSSVSKSMDRLKSSMGSLKGAVAGLIGGAGLGALALDLRNTADQIGKVSARLGVGSADLQKFQFAAMKGGMDVRQFNIALQRFTRRTSEAFIGTGEAKEAIEEFGLELRDSNGQLRSNSDLLMEVATIMASDLIIQADKARFAFKLFDSEGVKMLNMLQLGPEAIKGMGRELEALGGVINEETIVASEQLGDRWDMIMARVKNAFAPAIIVANDLLGVFTQEAEMAGMTSEQLEKHITGVRDSLIEKKKALDENDVGLKNLFLAARMSAGQIENEKKKIDESIASMNEQLDAMKKVKQWRDKQVEATLAQIKATQEENELRQQANNDQLLFNDLLAVQLQMYSEGMLMMEESAQKQKEINEQKIIDFHREIDEFERMETAKQEMQEATARATISTMASMASAVKDEGVELFRFWQAAAVANTWMSTYEAAMKAWAQLGIFGGPAAAAIAILGAAQIGKILSTKPPGKQAGGDVRPGETYLVGERGPELLTMGQYGGNVTPNRNLGQGVIINIYDGTGRKINQAMSDLRVEVVERAQQFGEFAALESRQYTQNAFA
tara:strand:- start:2793 stop:4511 length:1719 start_codon:yes stop_codon:yes gene_type:complete